MSFRESASYMIPKPTLVIFPDCPVVHVILILVILLKNERTVRDMDRYLKYILCQYPYICGQVYMSARGLAIQIM